MRRLSLFVDGGCSFPIEVEAGGDLGGDFLGKKAGAHPDKSSHKAQVHQHRVISGYKATLKSMCF